MERTGARPVREEEMAMRPSLRLTAAAALALAATGLSAAPAAAVPPDGPSGAVIVDDGRWLVRTAPGGGAAQLTFGYGRPGDVPLLGDWDGDGDETPGVARPDAAGTGWQWFLRNSNSTGPADVSFSFGDRRFVPVDRLGSVPVAGNFDPADDAYEIGVVLYPLGSTTGQLTWQIRHGLGGTSPVTSYAYGTAADTPVVGDWDGDGTDTAGVSRYPNAWYLNNRTLAGGGAQLSFGYGSSLPELPVVGDWDGNGTDTPAVLRNIPATAAEGPYQQWLFRNANSTGPASGSFVYGGVAQSLYLPVETIPRLTIET